MCTTHKRNLKIKEVNKLKNLKERNGITLVALVVTIVVLIILATITVTIVVGENGLINRAQQAKTMQESAKDKEELDTILLAYRLDNETKKAQGEGEQTLKTYLEGEDGVTNVKEKGDNLIVTFKGSQYSVNKNTLASGAYQSQGLKAEDEEKVLNALKSETKLLTVNYEPTPTDSTYIVPDKYSGVDISQDDLTVGQNFTQASLLGTGDNKLKWYVLSTDDEGVNLVSDITKAGIKFNDSPGYDNCLYYLDKVSKEFFSNESQYGVTKDRVHALRLTDIKKAAEQINAGVKIGERDWSWDENILGTVETDTSKTTFQGSADYTETQAYYPAIYKADGSGNVVCNNPLYDEEVIANPITTDSGIGRSETHNPATKLTVNNTNFWYSNKIIQMTNFGKGTIGSFGDSKIGDTLFTGQYYLACRTVYTIQDYAGFGMRIVSDGSLNGSYKEEYGDGWTRTTFSDFSKSKDVAAWKKNAFRLVVSVPASHITVADDGTVSLK